MATCIKIAQLKSFQDQLIITGYAYKDIAASNNIKRECATVPPPQSLLKVADGECCYIAIGGNLVRTLASEVYEDALAASKEKDRSVMGPTVQ
jgi:hypothetical protein